MANDLWFLDDADDLDVDSGSSNDLWNSINDDDLDNAGERFNDDDF